MAKFLNELGEDAALMKVDCEGGEYALFDSVSRNDMLGVSQISMELHHVASRNLSEIKDSWVQNCGDISLDCI